MLDESRLVWPVFFIGMGRSGTTLIFESFSSHRDLGWLSNYCDMFPQQLWLNVLCPLLDNRWLSLRGFKAQYSSHLPGNRYFPQPDEAYAFWDRYGTADFSDTYLLDRRATEEESQRSRRAVARVLRYQARHRFTAKITGPGRVTWLQSVFPDARFIHLVRDGRAVVDSLLRVDFWRARGLHAPFWKDPLPPISKKQWQAADGDPAVLAAVQWVNVLRTIRQEAERLPGSAAFTEIRYEDFTADPGKTLSEMYRFAELDVYPGLMERALGRVPILNFKDKYRHNLGSATVERITAVMRPELERYGYA